MTNSQIFGPAALIQNSTFSKAFGTQYETCYVICYVICKSIIWFEDFTILGPDI